MTSSRLAKLSFLTAVAFVGVLRAQEDSIPFQLHSFDGYVLDGVIESSITETEVTRAIVLIHGSGHQSMDSDLTIVTKNGEKNLFFAELGAALREAGFAVIRYNKRFYQLRQDAIKDPTMAQSDLLQRVQKNPLLHLVEDAKAAVSFARSRFPQARVYLLGHSQGTQVALYAAHENKDVNGVALIGFAMSPMSFLQFEQVVYRSLRRFRSLDLNHDESLDQSELAKPEASFITLQMATLDSDADGAVTRVEYQAAAMGSLVVNDPYSGAYLRQEATYPRIPEVLKATDREIVFLQGMFDNQTPAYHAKSIELINKQIWKKQNLRFHFFEGLGHALDPRDNYDDNQFRRIDPEAKERLTEILAERFN